MGQVHSDLWYNVFGKFVCPIADNDLKKKGMDPKRIKMIRIALAEKPVTLLKVVGLAYLEPRTGKDLLDAALAPESWREDMSLYWAFKVESSAPPPDALDLA